MWLNPKIKKDGKHPILQMEEVLQKDGIIVLENVTSIPVYGKPFSSPHIVISICHRGWVLAEYDARTVEFRPKEVCVVSPNHSLLAHESSPDYLATLIVISRETFYNMRQASTFRYQQTYHKQPAFPLTDDQYATISDMFGLIATACRLQSKHKPLILADLVDALCMLLNVYRYPDEDANAEINLSGELLFDRYYELIVTHHAETREVAYYAKQFNLSPKYFSTLIKRETGIAAGDWISNYIVIRAKTMLRNRPDLNIQQIGFICGFTDQAAFSRYFKTNTGKSPRAYRNKWG